MKTALTIAGSDSSGGAGIAADIKTMTANGVYAMCALTALTAQNTMGVSAISEVAPEFLKKQIDAVFLDIVPDAVKIGMVSSGDLVCVIAERLRFYKARNVVVDPVMIATSGSSLIKTDAISAMEKELFPIAALITPNIPEAEAICKTRISNREDMKLACREIYDKYKCAVLLKGGHSETSADDLLYSECGYEWFYGKRIDTENTHGTGCTLSSAIASNLAKGFSLEASVRRSKEYISGALAAGLNLGCGNGPMNHTFDLNSKFMEDK